jgi:hypothetical protein
MDAEELFKSKFVYVQHRAVGSVGNITFTVGVPSDSSKELEAVPSREDLLEQARQSYCPTNLADLIDHCPETTIDLAEKQLNPSVSVEELLKIPHSLTWELMTQTETPNIAMSSSKHKEHFVKIIETLSKHFARQELKEFAARVDRYYTLVPKNIGRK